MSGEMQTIPARHGTATFVPKGHTIKIVNIYGTQVIDTWAFALHKTPGEDEEDQKKAEAQKGNEKKKSAPRKLDKKASEQKKSTPPEKSETDVKKDDAKEGSSTEKQDSTKTAEDPASKPNEAEESVSEEKKEPDEDKSVEKKSDEGKSGEDKSGEDKSEQDKPAKDDKPAEESADKDKADKTADEKADAAMSKSWTSYLPSLRSKKSKGDAAESKAPAEKETKQDETKATTQDESKAATQDESKAAEGTSKGWSSYIPSGKAFSSYLPNKSTLSAFAASHHRDPNKSYAEQLYDFSKTPVGAASLSAATGSGTPGVLYAAYSAYAKEQASKDQSPMEYLSMPHTRASTQHLTPKVNDTLVSNLRAPLLTLIEDTSPGVHDTLIAACDPQRYKELGVEKWEEHGSCAENLVVALKELNEKSGLKGPNSVGADVTVNMVPAPLNLFMNIPVTQDRNISFEAPVSKRGDYVKFRAERDVVVVMSACPQDVLDINKKKPMAARFMVEEPKEEEGSKEEQPKEEAGKQEGAKTEISKEQNAKPPLKKKPSEQAKPPLTKKPSEQAKPSLSKRPSEQAKPPVNKKPSEQSKSSLDKKPSEQTKTTSEKKPSEQPSKANEPEAAPAQEEEEEEEAKKDPPKEKKKPKKLERRTGAATPVKSAS